MLFLADEDFPGIAVRWLRQAGHDVLWARTDMPGKADAALLAAAQAESRVILTCDKDFGGTRFSCRAAGVLWDRALSVSVELAGVGSGARQKPDGRSRPSRVHRGILRG
jgi:predicted nuclease of predicted toxin-antitoxin system